MVGGPLSAAPPKYDQLPIQQSLELGMIITPLQIN